MTIRVYAQTSGVTAEDLRLAVSAGYSQAAVLNARSGIIPAGGTPADLVSVAALQAKVTSFQAMVDGTSGFFQGGYLVTVDADVTLTFGAGSGSNPRVDLVVIRVRDDPYDASASQVGSVEIVAGTPAGTPVAPPAPASSLPLWQVLVPANASGANPIVFSTARTDRRTWTVATGGTIPVASAAERDAIATPHAGLAVYRRDTGTLDRYTGSAWVIERTPAVPTEAAYVASTSLASNPYPGMKALRVRVQAGGGGGGNADATAAGQSSSGGGGGGGGYAEAVIPLTSLTFPITITVGLGGPGNTAGGNSAFGTYVVALGGGGGGQGGNGAGAQLNGVGGAGGSATAGAFGVTGGAGTHGFRLGAAQGVAGHGGSGHLGGGSGGVGVITATANGTPGGVYGGGGGGARSSNGGGATSGGAGATGIVIVEPIY